MDNQALVRQLQELQFRFSELESKVNSPEEVRNYDNVIKELTETNKYLMNEVFTLRNELKQSIDNNKHNVDVLTANMLTKEDLQLINHNIESMKANLNEELGEEVYNKISENIDNFQTNTIRSLDKFIPVEATKDFATNKALIGLKELAYTLIRELQEKVKIIEDNLENKVDKTSRDGLVNFMIDWLEKEFKVSSFVKREDLDHTLSNYQTNLGFRLLSDKLTSDINSIKLSLDDFIQRNEISDLLSGRNLPISKNLRTYTSDVIDDKLDSKVNRSELVELIANIYDKSAIEELLMTYSTKEDSQKMINNIEKEIKESKDDIISIKNSVKRTNDFTLSNMDEITELTHEVFKFKDDRQYTYDIITDNIINVLEEKLNVKFDKLNNRNEALLQKIKDLVLFSYSIDEVKKQLID